MRIRSLLIGERIDIKALENTERLAESPLVVRAGARGCAVVFRYGVTVLFEMDAMEQTAFLRQLSHLIYEPFDVTETENASIVVQPDAAAETVLNGVVTLIAVDIERIQILADILAKSVVLEYYENQIARTIENIDPLTRDLERGHYGNTSKNLLRQIGGTLRIHQKMVGRVEVNEKPDVLWDHPEMERLYMRLEDEYELSERHAALERKLKLISLTAETILDLLNTKRSIRVEWYIVLLIVVEILLTLYELFLHK